VAAPVKRLQPLFAAVVVLALPGAARAADPSTIGRTSQVGQTPTGTPAPVNTALPRVVTVRTPIRIGDGVKADPGRWTGSPTAYAYQWIRCRSATSCEDIPGASGAAYQAHAVDEQQILRVRVAALNGQRSAPAESPPTGPVVSGRLRARLSIGPNPTCTGSKTYFDGSYSSGPARIVGYRLTLIQRGATGHKRRRTVISRSSNPVATHVFGWNRQLDNRPTFRRDPATVELRVTDATGTVATTDEPVHFAQSASRASRTSCPSAHVAAVTPVVKRAARAIRTSSVAVATTLPCHEHLACLGQLVLTGPKRTVLARKRFAVPAWKKGRVRATLTRRARRLLRARHRLTARASVAMVNAAGRVATRSKRVVLRAPR
jgi:hypothetical protein